MRKIMLLIGLFVAAYIWYTWFRGPVPYHKTWKEIQMSYEEKLKQK